MEFLCCVKYELTRIPLLGFGQKLDCFYGPYCLSEVCTEICCTHTHTHTYTRTRISTDTYTHTHTRTHIPTDTHTHTYTHTHTQPLSHTQTQTTASFITLSLIQTHTMVWRLERVVTKACLFSQWTKLECAEPLGVMTACKLHLHWF